MWRLKHLHHHGGMQVHTIVSKKQLESSYILQIMDFTLIELV